MVLRPLRSHSSRGAVDSARRSPSSMTSGAQSIPPLHSPVCGSLSHQCAAQGCHDVLDRDDQSNRASVDLARRLRTLPPRPPNHRAVLVEAGRGTAILVQAAGLEFPRNAEHVEPRSGHDRFAGIQERAIPQTAQVLCKGRLTNLKNVPTAVSICVRLLATCQRPDSTNLRRGNPTSTRGCLCRGGQHCSSIGPFPERLSRPVMAGAFSYTRVDVRASSAKYTDHARCQHHGNRLPRALRRERRQHS